MKSLAISLMFLGLAIFVVGGLMWLAARLNLPLGRLPGDLQWKGKGWAVYFPLMTMLLLSLLLTLILNIFFRR